jgi:hypothetical protein
MPSGLAARVAAIDFPKEGHERRVDFLRQVAGLEAAASFGKGQAGAFLRHQCQPALFLPRQRHALPINNSPS